MAARPSGPRRLGWVQLAGQQVSHRPDPRDPGYVLCDLPLPAATRIRDRQPNWPACPFCQQELQLCREEIRAALAAPPPDAKRSPAPVRGDRSRRSPAAEQVAPSAPKLPAVSDRIRERLATRPVLGDGPTGAAGTWQLPVGWVRLAGRPLWHRPHPEQPARTMCELLLLSEPIYRQRTTADADCPDCAAVRHAALSALRARDRQAPTPPRKAKHTPPPRAQVFRAGLPGLGRGR